MTQNFQYRNDELNHNLINKMKDYYARLIIKNPYQSISEIYTETSNPKFMDGKEFVGLIMIDMRLSTGKGTSSGVYSHSLIVRTDYEKEFIESVQRNSRRMFSFGGHLQARIFAFEKDAAAKIKDVDTFINDIIVSSDRFNSTRAVFLKSLLSNKINNMQNLQNFNRDIGYGNDYYDTNDTENYFNKLNRMVYIPMNEYLYRELNSIDPARFIPIYYDQYSTGKHDFARKLFIDSI